MDARERASRACNDAHEWHEAMTEQAMRREAARKAEAAPDREKLHRLAGTIESLCLSLPRMETPKSASVQGQIATRIMDLAEWIRGKAGEL